MLLSENMMVGLVQSPLEISAAMLKDLTGTLYLYTKTIERAHLPSKMWERVPLPSNYTQALELVSGLTDMEI